MNTLYDILGVNPQADTDRVKLAYRKLARSYHPDLNPDPKAHERMAEINFAFEVLSDPVRRMEYDSKIGRESQSEPSRRTKKTGAVTLKVGPRLRDHGTAIYGISFFPDDSQFVSCSFDNELIWWDTRGCVRHRHKMEGGVVSNVQAVGKGFTVAAGCTDQSLACWRISGEKVRVWRNAPPSWIACVSPSPDGEWLATGSNDRGLRVFRVANGETHLEAHAHQDAVSAVAWSQDSRWLATGAADATVKLWDVKAQKEVHTFIHIRSAVTSMAFSPDNQWLAVAAVDLSIRIFSLRDRSLHKTFFGHEKPVESMAFHPAGWLLASAGREGSLGLWNVKQGIGHGRAEISHQPLRSVAFNRGGDKLAVGGLDKILRVCDVRLNRTPA